MHSSTPLSGDVPLSYLNPGMSTVFSRRLLYQAWDVSSLLINTSSASGTHALGVRLGSCKYGLYTEFCAGNETVCTRFSALLVAFQNDGTYVPVASTDDQWLGNPQPPITYDHLYIGESYDQTLETQGWSCANASLPGWLPVPVVSPPTAALTPHLMPAISAIPTNVSIAASPAILPSSVVPVASRPGSFVFDYGLNHAGTFRLSLPQDFPRGVHLTVRMAERVATCAEDPSNGLACGVYNSFPCPAPCCPAGGGCSSMLFTFTTGGIGYTTQQYTPTFSTGGFRYLQLDGWPNSSTYSGQPDFNTLQAVWLTSSVGAVQRCHSGTATKAHVVIPSEPLLTTIAHAALASLSSNMLSHPTDCPTRERRGWTGDAQVTVDANMAYFRPVAVYLNWLRTMGDTADVGCSTAYNASTNTYRVFHADSMARVHDTLLASVVRPEATLLDPPAQRPDCYLCCSAKPGFGCEYDSPINVTGSLPDIMPVNGPSRAWPGSMCWTFAFWKVAHALVQAQGDAVSVAPYLQSLIASTSFYGNVANDGTGAGHGLPPGLLWYEAYGDWISNEATTPVFLANAHYITALRMLAFIASAAGQTSVSTAALLVASEVQDLLQQQWLHKNVTTGLWTWDTGSQTAQAVALAMGLSGQNATIDADVAAVLQANVAAHYVHPTVGVIGSRYLLQSLSMINRSDLALAVLK